MVLHDSASLCSSNEISVVHENNNCSLKVDFFCIITDMVTRSVNQISIVVIVMVPAVTIAVIVTSVLVFVGVKRKRAGHLQHEYDYPIIRLPPRVPYQQQMSTIIPIEGRQESSIIAFNTPESPFSSTTLNDSERAIAESTDSHPTTCLNTEADIYVRMDENSAYQPSTNFLFARNPAYGTNVAIALEIESEENAAYHCNTAIL